MHSFIHSTGPPTLSCDIIAPTRVVVDGEHCGCDRRGGSFEANIDHGFSSYTG